MQIPYIRLSSLICLTAISLMIADQLIPDKIPGGILAESISQVYGKILPVTWEKVILNTDQKRQLLQEMHFYKSLPDTLLYGIIREDSTVNYVFIYEAPSKTETFTFAGYLNRKGAIVDVDVLIYRENYGGEIDYPAFRRQFRGKKNAQELIFGRSIQGISGATISARSITLAMKDILTVFTFLNQRFKLLE